MLVATLLLVGFSGHAGVQVLDQDVAARIARLHLHGVSGEAAYVHSHAAPAPFVMPHCHAPIESTPSQPSPDQVQAATTLAGAMLCGSVAPVPAPPESSFAAGSDAAMLPESLGALPASPPPQS